MDEENKGTEITETIPTQTASVTVDDLSERVAQLEKEKAKILEEKTNYQAAYLKESAQNKEDESEDERIYRIANEALKASHLADISREIAAINQKALKENSELKRKLANLPDVSVSTTSHTESQTVKDTLITPDQMAQFKAMGKTDKWIESYKKNLVRQAR